MMPGMVGAALTKPGRVSTVRWGGSGERDGEEYARNRRLRLLSGHRLEPGGSGPGAVRLCLFFRAGNFLVGLSAPAGEATVKCCGVAVEAAGHSRAPPSSRDRQVNAGTVSVLPSAVHPVRCEGWAHRRLIGPGRGGAAVVVRGRESRSHGEGRQRFREGKEAAMPKEAPVNAGARDDAPYGAWSRVSGMQAKLHRWAAADPGRRFDDLFNLVHDPATLVVAFDRVAGNRGANTPGVDGLRVADVEERIGVRGFVEDLRAQLKTGTFRPLPVRERKIPKPGGSGKVRSLGITTVADRVVQAALKLVLEPIFEAGFLDRKSVG